MLYVTAMQHVYGGEHQPIGQPPTLRFEVLTGMIIPGDPLLALRPLSMQIPCTKAILSSTTLSFEGWTLEAKKRNGMVTLLRSFEKQVVLASQLLAVSMSTSGIT